MESSTSDLEMETNDLVAPPDKNDENVQVISERQKNLEYLLKQAELYAHFVTNGSKSKNGKQKATTRALARSAKRLRHDDEEDISEQLDASSVKVKIQFDETPTYIVGEMRNYQIRALNWLITLYENGINGILADEMGLGKTLQTISMLGYLKHYERVDGPHLIIAPNSTIQNWLNEINRFCPSLTGLILIGDKTARSETLQRMKKPDWNVCITSYEMCLLEKGPLKRINWKYVVVDEAHRIKNEKTKLSQILRTFISDNRLLLTGTPLQNNLHELWSLLNYLLPNVFASSDDFDTWFDSDNCLSGNNDIVDRLHKILRPFMLRRIKAEVEKSLLPKIEVKLFVGLTTMQRETYKSVLLKDVKILNTFGQQTTKIIRNMLMELRKAANHPYLIDNVEPGPPYTTDQHIVDNCGKMMVLDKLLAKLKLQGSRVVLFSQFIMMLNIFEDYLVWRGYKYCRIDGYNKYDERARSIDEFNAENSDKFVFILSTRAGGLGINLTTADTVIIYDSDWNPQADFQAIDRVHRIGQTKQVRVFRLITENTVDERIVQRAEIKQRLDKMVIQQGRRMDKETLAQQKEARLDAIRFGAEQILSAKDGSDVIDVDLEKILKDGELKTVKEKEELAKYNENDLRNLTLKEASNQSLYNFEGIDYYQKKQESSQNNKLSAAGRPLRTARLNNKPNAAQMVVNTKNLIKLHQHQFFPKKLYELSEDGEYLDLSYNAKQKKALMQQGFTDWSKENFTQYCKAMYTFGRKDLNKIAKMVPGKTLAEIQNYHQTFWEHGSKNIDRYKQIAMKVERAERKIKQNGVTNKPLQINQLNQPKQHILTPKTNHQSNLLDSYIFNDYSIPSASASSLSVPTISTPSLVMPNLPKSSATSKSASSSVVSTLASPNSLSKEKSTYSLLKNEFFKVDGSLDVSTSDSDDSDDSSIIYIGRFSDLDDSNVE